MQIHNTIYQSQSFNQTYEKVKIDEQDVYFSNKENFISISSSLVPIGYYNHKVFDYFFRTYPKAKFIKFERAFQTDEKLPYKMLRIKHFDNNFRLELPDTIEEYRASLGKKTRMHLGQYQRHIEKELYINGGGYYMKTLSEETRDILNAIIDLNHERCESKGFKSGADKDRLYNQIKNYGILNYLTIGNKIVAGTIGSIYNNQFCLHAIAHSNAYGKLNPGNVILYKTIENAIEQKIPVFNFLWGNCEYKTRFGAKEVLLYDYYLYRKYSDYLISKIKLCCALFFKNIKKGIKSILRPPYHAVKWLYHNTLKRPQKSLGYIFMLHRVDEFEEGHLWCNEHMKVTPAFLDEQLACLKEKFDIIPLAEVPARLKQKNDRKFIVFTMDDGYKDNYTKALPVFKKHNVPYTIFVTTDFPDQKAVLWWYELENLLLKNKSITLSNGTIYPSETYKQKCDSFLKIREEILKLDQLNLENELNKLFAGYKINWTGQCEKLCLSWNDIKFLKNEPLVTIGAHTKHHYNLKQLATKDDVKNEVLAGVELLKQNAGIEPAVFAYPFGSSLEAGKREYKVLSELPFVCSCIAFGGPCSKKDAEKLSSLPRIMFKQSFNIKDLK